VGQWISSFWRVLFGESEAVAQARRALDAARRGRVELALEPPNSATSTPIVMAATIEQVRASDLVITQPVSGGVTQRLVTGEPLRLSISVGKNGCLSGTTRVLGRAKITSGAATPLYGYRLAVPEGLYPADRRKSKRADRGFDLAREAELYKLDENEPIRGVVQNVSHGGMQIRTHEARPRLTKGERIRLVVYLPLPVGEVNRMVQVVRLTIGRNPRQRIVGVAFEREVSGLAELIGEAKGD
jgi:hypothetical protein